MYFDVNKFLVILRKQIMSVEVLSFFFFTARTVSSPLVLYSKAPSAEYADAMVSIVPRPCEFV